MCRKVILKNLLPVWLLMRTNMFVPSHFWTTCTKFNTCCQRIATCGKSFIWVRIYLLGPTLLETLKKSLSYLYEVVRTIFSVDFWSFRNFYRNFAKNCVAIYRLKWELCSASERAIPSEKKLKTASKSAYKRQCNACWNYATLERKVLRTRSVTKNNKKLSWCWQQARRV